jgi:GT2 family glycosyltransferase
MITISVVIATYNRKDQLAMCLAAVSRQEHLAHEIIVVDDASTDGTGDMVNCQYPEVRYFHQPLNRGPAAARNLGLLAAKGEVVAFTDDDCLVPTYWLQQLANGFSRYQGVVGVGGFQDPPEGLIRSNYIARAEHLARLRRWGVSAFDEEIGGYEVPGFGTNNAAYLRAILMEVGGFDESFPVAAGEDADLKLRVASLGRQLLYLPLKVEHRREYSLRTQWQSALRRGIGAYYFESKHVRPPTMARIGLRLGKRSLQFFPDMTRLGWQVAAVNLLTRIGDGVGQLQMALGSGPEPIKDS